MPSKNSINRPKLTSNLNRRAQKAGIKRSQREQNGQFQPARSSEQSKSGEIKSVALDLYFKDKADDVVIGPKVTRNTLSKKRAKKIERNLKYAQQRKNEDRLLTDLHAKLENEMDVDVVSKKVKNEKNSKLSMVKKAMWNVLEDAQSQQELPLTTGQGTTLGGAWFP